MTSYAQYSDETEATSGSALHKGHHTGLFAGWTVGGSICVLYLLDGLTGRITIHIKGRERKGREGRGGTFKVVFGKVLPHSLGGLF